MKGVKRHESILSLIKRESLKSEIIDFLEIRKRKQNFLMKEFRDKFDLPVNVKSEDILKLLNKIFPPKTFKNKNENGERCMVCCFTWNNVKQPEEAPKPQPEKKEVVSNPFKDYGITSEDDNDINEDIVENIPKDVKDFFVKTTRDLLDSTEERGMYLEDIWKTFDKYRIRRGFDIIRILLSTGLFDLKDRVKSANDIRRPYLRLIEEKKEQKQEDNLFLVPSSISISSTTISNLGDKRIININPKNLTKSEVLEILKNLYSEKAQFLTSDEEKKKDMILFFENILKED